MKPISQQGRPIIENMRAVGYPMDQDKRRTIAAPIEIIEPDIVSFDE
jgi:hypothetical protein